MSHIATLMSRCIDNMKEETFKNMIELGFTLKNLFEEEVEHRMGPVLREIFNKIDHHLGTWSQNCYFKILTHTDDAFRIVCFNGKDEIFTVQMNYQGN